MKKWFVAIVWLLLAPTVWATEVRCPGADAANPISFAYDGAAVASQTSNFERELRVLCKVARGAQQVAVAEGLYSTGMTRVLVEVSAKEGNGASMLVNEDTSSKNEWPVVLRIGTSALQTWDQGVREFIYGHEFGHALLGHLGTASSTTLTEAAAGAGTFGVATAAQHAFRPQVRIKGALALAAAAWLGTRCWSGTQTRKHEYQADAFALKALQMAGVPATTARASATRLFSSVHETDYRGKACVEGKGTHPSTEERLKRLQSPAATSLDAVRP